METTHTSHATPKDFFMNLGIVGTLYFILVNFIILTFSTIDVAFPATPESSNYIPDISFPLAALIIGFPLFLALSRVMYLSDARHQVFPVRKWLTYLTLFVSGAVIVVDLIVLLQTFLSGTEITTAFLLKVFVLFAVFGLTFGYYLIDLFYTGKYPLRLCATVKSIVFVLLALGFGFYVFGSPATQRAKRFDTERVSDLQNIQSQVVSYWQTKRAVPESLEALKDPIMGMIVPVDPQTTESYEYQKVSANAFKLCATFERAGGKDAMGVRTAPVVGMGDISEYWGHDAGRVCFDRSIDPEKFPEVKR